MDNNVLMNLFIYSIIQLTTTKNLTPLTYKEITMTKEKFPARFRTKIAFFPHARHSWMVHFHICFSVLMKELSAETSPSLLYPEPLPGKNLTGTTEEITVPVPMMFHQAETMVITSTFRQIFDASSIVIVPPAGRKHIHKRQSYKRTVQHTSKTRLIGKNSASRFIFCSTSMKMPERSSASN